MNLRLNTCVTLVCLTQGNLLKVMKRVGHVVLHTARTRATIVPHQRIGALKLYWLNYSKKFRKKYEYYYSILWIQRT